MMQNMYVDKWFKLPPKEKLNKMVVVKITKRSGGRKRGKSCKKIKK